MDDHDHEHAAHLATGPALDDGLTDEDKEEIYMRALCRARMKMALYIHATGFAAVILLLAVINLLTTPRSLWVIWPFMGWGILLLLHWFVSSKLVEIYERIKADEIARQLEQRKP